MEIDRCSSEMGRVLWERDCLVDFMRAVAQELDCMPSYTDPRPNGGNAHIIEKLRKMAAPHNEEHR